jgi:glycosyltransferase involved in cell wall biosynthesis
MSEIMPLISVIIPCFNAAAYLTEALNSVFMQKVSSMEVIVIDDGSTDDSASIALSYSSQLKYFFQENQGISAARNQGLTLAKGEFIAFLDADDLWLPDTLVIRLNYLQAEINCAGVFGQTECFISPELPKDKKDELVCPTTPIAGRMAGAMLVRKQIYQNIGTFDIKLQVGEMMDWVARAEALGMSFDAISTIVLRRRLHSTNTVRGTQRLHSDYLSVLRASIIRRRYLADSKNQYKINE